MAGEEGRRGDLPAISPVGWLTIVGPTAFSRRTTRMSSFNHWIPETERQSRTHNAGMIRHDLRAIDLEQRAGEITVQEREELARRFRSALRQDAA